MSSFSSINIHCGDTPIEEFFFWVDAFLLKQGYYFTLRYHQSLPWVQLWVEEMENVSYYTQQISKLLPEHQIIGLATQSVVDAVGYWQYLGGPDPGLRYEVLLEQRIFPRRGYIF